MQNDVQRSFGADKLAVYFDVIACGRLRAEIGAGASVDRDATGGDQFIARAARTNAGGGEITVQPHG